MSQETEDPKTPKDVPVEEPVPDTERSPTSESEKPPEWEFKKEFGINVEMKKVVHLTISATESELVLLRRKLAKLQYGS
jgi:hypothetical protein